MTKVFDCNCCVGFSINPEEQKTLYIEELINVMELYGIDEVLVWNITSKNYDAKLGNKELINRVNGTTNIHPCWIITPYQSLDFPTSTKLHKIMDENGIKCVRIWPSDVSSNFSLKPWIMNEFYHMLTEFKIPLFIELSETNWDEVYEIAVKYPKMPIVVTGVSYRDARYIFSIFELCKNVYIETSMYKAYRALECLIKRFGSDKILFGTGYPKYSIGSALALITYSMIKEDDKRKILYGNITNLLSEVIMQ